MKYIYYTASVFAVAFVLAVLSSGCSINKELVEFSNGKNGSNGSAGKDGKDGSNGHSLVGLVVEYLETCQNGGSALDLYLDLDDSLSVTEGDLFQGQLLACNGSNGQDGLDGEDGQDGSDGENGDDGSDGLAGPMGPQGPSGSPGSSVIITTYSTSSCMAISGTVYYVKLNNLYSHSSCHSHTKVAELSGGDDTFWVSSTKLAVENGSSSIRVINY